ncbi:hypothetical protein T440DRAFT_184660 [Plenodomus tracheiphilus IPT5]|uniref:Uncharacterized protein n=1 Tax=Plenodomus tracheiphilus IPT5 TaxID=1408161 RepID=A0A6A7AYJ6_9PLEO|nr:hypothetical protein T440DRAFT_184660 [Plenodomus tracheiphilus IPT5]
MMDRRLVTTQTNGETSPDRPPQLKLCGFRCGYGCEEPTDDDGDGGGSDQGSEATYVESNNQGDMRLEMNGRDNDQSEIFGQERTNALLLQSGSEDQHHSELVNHPDEDAAGMASSLEVRSCPSSDHSREMSAHGSVRMMTPGPGIGVWAEDRLEHVNRFPLEYYFLQTPLRLSPQYEHCRGDSLSHFIVPDRPLRIYTLENVWFEYVVGHRMDMN